MKWNIALVALVLMLWGLKMTYNTETLLVCILNLSGTFAINY